MNFRAIFGQKIGKNDKNLKLFFKIFWHRPPFSQQISENKIRQRWSKYPPCFFKILQTRGGITSAIHRHPHRKKFSSHRHRHRKKLFLSPSPSPKKIFLSPSPSPKKSFLVTITVTVTVNKSFCHRHRNRWAVTVTTVFSPPVTCHR